MHPPRVCHQVADERRQNAWSDRVIADLANRQHLDAEDRTRQRRPEH